MMMPNWTPAKEGVDFEFSPTLKPLEPFRDRVIVMSGLSSKPPANRRPALPPACTPAPRRGS